MNFRKKRKIFFYRKRGYVEFPAHQTTYGLVRNGDWGQVSIPVEDIRGEFIDLRMMSYEFVILEENGLQCEFAIDDIYWTGGTTESMNDIAQSVVFQLEQNYPNPFNPETRIAFSLSERSDVRLEIFNLKGQRIKTLMNKNLDSGSYSISWNGVDDRNNPVSSGIYVYHLRVGNSIKSKKCILLK